MNPSDVPSLTFFPSLPSVECFTCRANGSGTMRAERGSAFTYPARSKAARRSGSSTCSIRQVRSTSCSPAARASRSCSRVRSRVRRAWRRSRAVCSSFRRGRSSVLRKLRPLGVVRRGASGVGRHSHLVSFVLFCWVRDDLATKSSTGKGCPYNGDCPGCGWRCAWSETRI